MVCDRPKRHERPGYGRRLVRRTWVERLLADEYRTGPAPAGAGYGGTEQLRLRLSSGSWRAPRFARLLRRILSRWYRRCVPAAAPLRDREHPSSRAQSEVATRHL